MIKPSMYADLYKDIKDESTIVGVKDKDWLKLVERLNSYDNDIEVFNFLRVFTYQTFMINLNGKTNIEHLKDFRQIWPLFHNRYIKTILEKCKSLIDDYYKDDTYENITARHDGWMNVYLGRDKDEGALKYFEEAYKNKSWKNEQERHKTFIILAYRLYENGDIKRGIKIAKKGLKWLKLRFFIQKLKDTPPIKIKYKPLHRVIYAWSVCHFDYDRFATNLMVYLYRLGEKKYLNKVYKLNAKGNMFLHNYIVRFYTGLTRLSTIEHRPQHALRIMEIIVDKNKCTDVKEWIEEWWYYFSLVISAFYINYYMDYEIDKHIMAELYFEIEYLLRNIK